MIASATSIVGLGAKSTPKDVAAKVQGRFMEVMLKSMDERVDAADGLYGNSASSDIYRGMLRQQLAATMTAQMKSPLEGQLDKALTRSSAARAAQTGDSGSNSPVSDAIAATLGGHMDSVNNSETRDHA